MSSFTFQFPLALCGLLFIIPLAALLVFAQRKRSRLVAQMGAGASRSRKGRDGLRLGALVLLVLAVARPGYSPERRSVSQSGRDVVFAIDVSRSMLAQDAPPSRLEAAKQGVRDALEGFGSERAGLVIYAGSATILCPLTFDYDFVRYMLDQATPRAVDFGGTTLLSAVEKSVDNLFSDERRGMQDLVVLTDGEDHGPEMSRVATLLKEGGVDLLLVGLGDATSGSRIPVEDEEGAMTYLRHDGNIIYTRLQDRGLRELAAAVPGASYIAPGSGPFDLGAVYGDYALGKPVAGAVGAETFVVYREAGFPLIAAALMILLVAERWRIRAGPAALAGLVMVAASVKGEEAWLEAGFAKASRLQVDGKFTEALEAYGELDAGMESVGVAPAQTAAMRFNQGLCHLGSAEAVAEESPHDALAAARQAQRCFLEARRMDRSLARAGQRLDGTAALIAVYEEEVRKQEEQDQEMQKQLNDLIERLEKLLGEQTGLHGEVRAMDPKVRREPNPRRGVPRPPLEAPENAAGASQAFASGQEALERDGRAIHRSMEMLDRVMTPPAVEGMPSSQSILTEPVRLMTEVVAAQREAIEPLEAWSTWEVARTKQQVAIARIQEILDLLAGDNEGESDEGDWEDYEEDWEMDEYEDAEDGMPSSMSMTGDLAAGSEMQPLPVPNYEAEDLLMEEQGSMQFRQQQRAKANAGKVEKDW